MLPRAAAAAEMGITTSLRLVGLASRAITPLHLLH